MPKSHDVDGQFGTHRVTLRSVSRLACVVGGARRPANLVISPGHDERRPGVCLVLAGAPAESDPDDGRALGSPSPAMTRVDRARCPAQPGDPVLLVVAIAAGRVHTAPVVGSTVLHGHGPGHPRSGCVHVRQAARCPDRHPEH